MIRPLRSRHRHTIVVLCGLVPLLFVAGLLARRPMPRMDGVPGGWPAVPSAPAVISQSDVAWSSLPIRTTWLRGDAAARPMVRIEILDVLKRPDLLVYWSATTSVAALPADAILLGGIADGGTGTWPLPTGADAGGVLLLYSLAESDVVGSCDVPADVAAPPEADG